MTASAPTVDHVALPPDHTLMVLRGALSRDTVASLTAAIDQHVLRPSARYLVLDLAEVSHCDPAMLPALARAARELCARRGWLRLVAVSPAVLAALQDTDLPDLIALYHGHHGTPDAPTPTAHATAGR